MAATAVAINNKKSLSYLRKTFFIITIFSFNRDIYNVFYVN
ncbi:hypothetical protein BMG_5797 (plasmid) [Priestia megaterium]|nr:hypothetical protein BMG_5797 [Priestia megaterium]